MNGAHFHLVVNHLPIVGLLIGILILITGLALKKVDIQLTALGVLSSAQSLPLWHLTLEKVQKKL
ncbi:MAG: hypothetical protein IPN87_03750 [Saprospiraceae bacterium]|nr:hypothetical protein [Candidatus Brachybacter algidus]